MSNLLNTPPPVTMDFDKNQNLHHQNPIYHRNTYDLNSRIMLTAVLSLSFVILLVIILHIYARCVLRSPRGRLATTLSTLSHRHPPPSEAAPPPKSGLDPIVIQALPSFLYKQSNLQEDQIECSVCLSFLEEGELARKLPNCNHVFHMPCIDNWLTGQSTCPVCRSEAAPRMAPRMAPHEREPPMGSRQLEEVVVVEVGSESHHQIEIEHDLVQGNNCNESSKANNNIGNIGPSSSSSTTRRSSSFRLSSFRRMLGRDHRSSSSRRIIQVCGELDLERQGNH